MTEDSAHNVNAGVITCLEVQIPPSVHNCWSYSGTKVCRSNLQGETAAVCYTADSVYTVSPRRRFLNCKRQVQLQRVVIVHCVSATEHIGWPQVNIGRRYTAVCIHHSWVCASPKGGDQLEGMQKHKR